MKSVKGIDDSFLVSLVALAASTIAVVLILLWLIPLATDDWLKLNMMYIFPAPTKFFIAMSLSFRESIFFVLPLIIVALAAIISFGFKAKDRGIYSKIFNIISLVFLVFIISSIFALLMPFRPGISSTIAYHSEFEIRLITWWVIGLSLAIKYFFVRQLFGFSVKKAVLADFVMNFVSTVVGIFLIPYVGGIWEYLSYFITFHLNAWATTYLIAVTINAIVESLVIRNVFKTKVGKRGFWGLFIANAISGAVALVYIYIAPPA